MWANLLNPLQNLATGTTSILNPPPVCGAECQKQKKLVGLKTALDAKEATRDQDPVGYQQARMAYYTELNGQGWLATEKERIAKEEIDPKVTSYTNQFNRLIDEDKYQTKMMDFMSAVQAEQNTDTEQLKYLQKLLNKDNIDKNVLNRLSELNDTTIVTKQSSNYIITILEVVMVILGLIIAYMVYKKFDKIMGYNQSSMPIGGKRVPH